MMRKILAKLALGVALLTVSTHGALAQHARSPESGHNAPGLCVHQEPCVPLLPPGLSGECFRGRCNRGLCEAERIIPEPPLVTRTIDTCSSETVVCQNGALVTTRHVTADGTPCGQRETPVPPPGRPGCTLTPTCQSGICQYSCPQCGDGIVSPGEQCEPSISGDKCRADCMFKSPCEGVAPPDTHGRAGCPRPGWPSTVVICARGVTNWDGGWAGAWRFVYSSTYGIRSSRGWNGRVCWQCVCARRRGAGCFDPRTEIALADGGSVPVRDLKAGDRVFNPMTKAAAQVESIVEGPEEKLFLIIFDTPSGPGRTKLSAEHVVQTAHGMKRASALTPDDEIVASDGALVKVTSIEVVEATRVINFVINSQSTDPNDHFVSSDGVTTGDLWLQTNLKKIVESEKR